MSSGANSGSSTPKLPVLTSPLARAPKFSPPTSRNTSPRRKPLHDRSNSQSNQFSGPTIRIVEDPGTDVYSKTPFPSQPSQVLPPRNAPGYSFEGRGAHVSESNFVTNAVAHIESSRTLVPRPLHPKRAIRHRRVPRRRIPLWPRHYLPRPLGFRKAPHPRHRRHLSVLRISKKKSWRYLKNLSRHHRSDQLFALSSRPCRPVVSYPKATH
jgi:hypothetical protein